MWGFLIARSRLEIRRSRQAAVDGKHCEAREWKKRKPDLRIRRTCERLGGALVALIQEKPIDDVTVQEVLDRASVGRSTFYLHYRDKDDLLLSQFEKFLDEAVFFPGGQLGGFVVGQAIGFGLGGRETGGDMHGDFGEAEFGGGFVTGLNGGEATVPECAGGFSNLAVAKTRILQGSQTEITVLSKGEHLFQCCIHPWMRVKVEVREHDHDHDHDHEHGTPEK